MNSKTVEQILNRIPQLEKTGHTLAHAIHGAVLRGGNRLRDLADVLHGTWLGHPLHPVLTDIVVGAWSLGACFDLLSLFDRSPQTETTADALTTIGNYAALPTILSGITDYSTIPHPATSMGFAHALLNNTGYALQIASAAARKHGRRNSAMALSSMALLLLTTGVWLGGQLAYGKKVGVNHAEPAQKPNEWTFACAADALPAGEATRVDVAGTPVLLYRQNNHVLAMGAVCPHAGGPLEKGDFFDGCVQCPWHDSVFDLTSGRVVHGPATYSVSSYDARIHNGQVEVRLASHT